MARIWTIAFMLIVALTLASPVSAAEEAGTFIRAYARVDLSGHTELVIHKAYAGQLGPIRDVIGIQDPNPDGYPKVEITTSGAVRATRESGGIVVESTGPGLGEIDIIVTGNRLRSSWFLQESQAPGVGAVRLNAMAEFGDGLHAAGQGNQVTVHSPTGQERKVIDAGAYRQGWSANDTIPAGSLVLFEIAGEPDRVAPLWMAEAGLGLAALALALSGYLALKLRRITSLRSPSI